ncbi:hypothetical protein E2C01_055472 [Portunus trituberculatus]|uniref:Uncharacterized protein n=1 Tax=Portunus trituberculatus TaxID=210409 RepID=A0A5B7GMI9_PORTR|nr:hypothetical protein [Portunus trituberculatus]
MCRKTVSWSSGGLGRREAPRGCRPLRSYWARDGGILDVFRGDWREGLVLLTLSQVHSPPLRPLLLPAGEGRQGSVGRILVLSLLG